jgi:hypothetical protein
VQVTLKSALGCSEPPLGLSVPLGRVDLAWHMLVPILPSVGQSWVVSGSPCRLPGGQLHPQVAF